MLPDPPLYRCRDIMTADDGGCSEMPFICRNRKVRFFDMSWQWTAVDRSRLRSVWSTIFFGLVRPNTR